MGCKYCGMPPGGEPGDGCCKAAALDSCRAALEIQRKRIAALEALLREALKYLHDAGSLWEEIEEAVRGKAAYK